MHIGTFKKMAFGTGATPGTTLKTALRTAFEMTSTALAFATLALMLALACPAAPAYAETSVELEARLQDALVQLEDYGKQVVDAGEQLSDTRYQLELTNQQVKEMERLIEKRDRELAAARERLAARVVATYKNGNGGPTLLALVLQAESFEELVNGIYYADKVSEADAKAVQEVEGIKRDLERRQDKLERLQAEQESLAEEQAQQVAELERLQAEQKDYVAQLEDEVMAKIEEERQALLEEQRAEIAELLQNGDLSTYELSSETRRAIIDAALSQLGVPYVIGGSTPGKALDCSGLVQYCFQQVGISLPHSAAAQASIAKERKLSELEPGDLIFWIGTGDPRVTGNHVAIYLGGGKIVHAVWRGVCVQTLSSGYTQFGTFL